MKKIILYIYGTTLLCIALLSSCSTNKNTVTSRFYQGLTTRYNVYYNGNQNFLKASQNQLQNFTDDYTRLIPVHPVGALNGKTNNEFDRTIEKCQKAIKTHSIKIKPTFTGVRSGNKYREWQLTEEYNPYLHNAWLLMAKAQFFKGDFDAASSTFTYITRHFRNLPLTVKEAQIWNARCNVEQNQLYEAEDVLSKIKLEDIQKEIRQNNASKSLLSLYCQTQADLKLKQKLIKEATPFLELALTNEKNKVQHYRLNFLLGQIYELSGDKTKSFEAFKKVIKSSPPYETEFAARIRQTESMPTGNKAGALKKLTGMIRSLKYKDYKDQLYYAIGNIYLSQKDSVNAIKNFILAIEKSKKNVNQKVLVQIKLGDLYFEKKKYPEAQPCYGGALASLTKDHPDYDRLSKRSDALDELIVHYQSVHLQDSLIHMASLDETARLKAVEKIITELNKKEKAEKDQLEREKMSEMMAQHKEEAANDFATGRMPQRGGVSTAGSNDKSWYFYNTASVNKGKADFQSRWGSRKLEDNWRRRNKSAYVFGEQENAEKQTASTIADVLKKDSTQIEIVSDPKSPKFYLQQIPSTPEELQNANNIVSEGLYNMALVYQNRLEDYPLSVTTYNQLLNRYPNTANKIDVYYNLYLIAQMQNDAAQTEVYKNKIISEFPQSKYAVGLSDPAYLTTYKEKTMVIDSLYNQTYQAFLHNNMQIVRQALERVKKEAPLSKLIPKFMFLNALTYISEKKNAEFRKSLNELLEKYPQADVSELAGSMMSNLVQGKQISSEKVKTDIWSTQLNATTTSSSTTTESKAEFTIDPISPHLMLFVYPADSTYNNRLIYEVAGFNFTNFAIRDFDMDMFPLQGIGLLRVKGFNTFDEAKIYRQRLFGPKGIANRLPSQLKTVLISEKNFESLLKGRSFDEYFIFFEKNFSSGK